MSTASPEPARGIAGEVWRVDEEMAELVLLLPTRQAAALERAARAQGLTTGQVLRRLVRGFLAGSRPRRPG